LDCIAIRHEEAQRDADAAWYEKLEMQYLDDCREVNEMQIRQDTAREIFEEIETGYHSVRSDAIIISWMGWQSLKAKHLKAKSLDKEITDKLPSGN